VKRSSSLPAKGLSFCGILAYTDTQTHFSRKVTASVKIFSSMQKEGEIIATSSPGFRKGGVSICNI